MSLSAYVINLDRMPERWARVEKRLVTLGVDSVMRISGVDGLQADFSSILLDHAQSQKLFGMPLGRGTLGCYLSHVQAWQAFLASNQPVGLICEDDITFEAQPLQGVLEWVLQEANLWDICSLQLNHRGGPVRIAQKNEWRLCGYFFSVTGAGAYLMNRRAAQSLLEHAFPVGMPVDYYYTQGPKLGVRFTGLETLTGRRFVRQEQGPSAIEDLGRERHSQNRFFVRMTTALYKILKDAWQGFYTLGWVLRQKFS